MSDSVGCGAAGADSCPGSSRSTPITPRSSSSAWRAVERSSSAVSRTFSGGRSGWTSSAPACSAISEIRWASTSCISRAIRVRSAMPDPVGVQTLIGLGAQGTLAQGEQELASGPDEHAPGGRRERERGDQQDHRERVGRGAVDGEDQQRTGSTAQRRAAPAGRCGARRGRTARGARRGWPRSRTPPARHRPARRRAASAAATTARGRPATRRRRRRPAAGSTTARRCRAVPGSGRAPRARRRGGTRRRRRPVAAGPRTDRVRLGRIDRCQQRLRRQLLGREPAWPGHDPSVEAGARAGHRRKSDATATKGGAGRVRTSAFPTSGRSPPADVQGTRPLDRRLIAVRAPASAGPPSTAQENRHDQSRSGNDVAAKRPERHRCRGHSCRCRASTCCGSAIWWWPSDSP